MATEKTLKDHFKQADIIKIRFNSVGRFYKVSKEKLIQLYQEGKLKPSVVKSLFRDIKKPKKASKKASSKSKTVSKESKETSKSNSKG